jgi:hypothetical protein
MGRVIDMYFAFGCVRFPTFFVDKSVCKGTYVTLNL